MTLDELARCEELFGLVKSASSCLAQGDQTACYEPRGSRAPAEVRGKMLPREYWCANCKIRTQAEEVIKEIRDG